MAVQSDQDLAVFFDPRDFGCEALYSARSGELPYMVAGLFDESPEDFAPTRWPGGHPYQMQEGAHLTGSAPIFRCAASDLVKGGRPRDRLDLNGTTWMVQEAKADGTGEVTLVLMDNSGDPLLNEADKP